MPDHPPVEVLALDVGGAAIKAADGCGWAHDEPFAMWREWQRLPDVLGRIVAGVAPRRVVATMTGEIADCFPNRAAGVAAIVTALESAAAGCGASLGIYLVDGSIVSPAEARSRPLAAAASNWHAVARLAASLAPAHTGLLVDIGSTTTDIVPFAGGRPAPLALDDAGRLLSGELVYTGIERTPVAAIVRWLPHETSRRPVVAERFADSRDAWLILGGMAEDPAFRDTADGGPATCDAARRRLARTMLLEERELTHGGAIACATCVADAQATLIARAMRRVIRRRGWTPQRIVVSGHGTALAWRALDRLPWRGGSDSLAERFGAGVSRSAPAHAVAAVARGEIA